LLSRAFAFCTREGHETAKDAKGTKKKERPFAEFTLSEANGLRVTCPVCALLTSVF
jgi:hypothetical protein